MNVRLQQRIARCAKTLALEFQTTGRIVGPVTIPFEPVILTGNQDSPDKIAQDIQRNVDEALEVFAREGYRALHHEELDA